MSTRRLTQRELALLDDFHRTDPQDLAAEHRARRAGAVRLVAASTWADVEARIRRESQAVHDEWVAEGRGLSPRHRLKLIREAATRMRAVR